MDPRLAQLALGAQTYSQATRRHSPNVTPSTAKTAPLCSDHKNVVPPAVAIFPSNNTEELAVEVSVGSTDESVASTPSHISESHVDNRCVTKAPSSHPNTPPKPLRTLNAAMSSTPSGERHMAEEHTCSETNSTTRHATSYSEGEATAQPYSIIDASAFANRKPVGKKDKKKSKAAKKAAAVEDKPPPIPKSTPPKKISSACEEADDSGILFGVSCSG